MQTTSVIPWLRSRRFVALIAAAALIVSLAFAMIGNSWTANAAPENPDQVVVEDELVLAGPSWTFSTKTVKVPLPTDPVDGDVVLFVELLGPSWG